MSTDIDIDRLRETVEMALRNLRGSSHATIQAHELLAATIENLSITPEEKQELKKFLDIIKRQEKYKVKIYSNTRDFIIDEDIEPFRPVVVYLHRLVNNVLSMMEIPEEINLSVLISGDLQVKIDPWKMRRVLINLVRNALQAMPKGGELMIGAYPKDRNLVIKIWDTGSGISQENLDKMFSQRFTTKPDGKGWGLLVCKKIIEDHQGSILVESEVGAGSTFTIKLPEA